MLKVLLLPSSVVLALLMPAGVASAVALVFTGISGPGGEAAIDIWFEDPTREVFLRAIQFDIDALAVGAALRPDCAGATCAKQAAADATNRIYLGSFSVNYDGTIPLYVTVPADSILGEGDNQPENGLDPVIAELRSRACCRILIGDPEIDIPEPAGLPLMALVLVALRVIRSRSVERSRLASGASGLQEVDAA